MAGEVQAVFSLYQSMPVDDPRRPQLSEVAAAFLRGGEVECVPIHLGRPCLEKPQFFQCYRRQTQEMLTLVLLVGPGLQLQEIGGGGRTVH
jgi:hypothetical protein